VPHRPFSSAPQSNKRRNGAAAQGGKRVKAEERGVRDGALGLNCGQASAGVALGCMTRYTLPLHESDDQQL